MKLFKSLSLIFNYAIFKKYLTFLGQVYTYLNQISLLIYYYFYTFELLILYENELNVSQKTNINNI